MKAVVLDQPGHFRSIQMEEPSQQPGSGEALVRIHRIGICGTDLHAFRGKQPFFTYPRILGHELGVEVVAVGPSDQEIQVGARCALEPYFACGTCSACQRGKSNCCLKLQVFGVHIDGGMRELVTVPARYLHQSKSLSYEQLALVEPLAIGAHAVSRAQLVEGEPVLVVGTGPIGLAVTQFALLAGAQVTVMDISEQRLAFCRQLWPQVTCIHGSEHPLEALHTVFGDELPVAVFDATGNAQSMHAAFSFVGQGGRLIFVGILQGDISFHDPDFHRRELTLLSSRNAVASDFRYIIRDLEEGKIKLDAWITHRATFDTIADLFPDWLNRDSGIIKAVVTP